MKKNIIYFAAPFVAMTILVSCSENNPTKSSSIHPVSSSSVTSMETSNTSATIFSSASSWRPSSSSLTGPTSSPSSITSSTSTVHPSSSSSIRPTSSSSISSSSITPVVPFKEINNFNSESDLTRFKKNNPDASGNITYSLNTIPAYIFEGAGSLKYQTVKACDNFLVFPFKDEGKSLFDLQNLAQIEFSIYNATSADISGSSYLYSSTQNILSENFTLTALSWNRIIFKIPGIIVEELYNSFEGFKFNLHTSDNFVSYIDNVQVMVGLDISEEERLIQNKIHTIKNNIDGLPAKVSASDYENIKAIRDSYFEIPEKYRILVTNFNALEKKIIELGKEMPGSFEIKNQQELLGFDKFYGVGQISVNSATTGTGTEISYTSEKKFDEEQGSTKVQLNGAEYTYLDLFKDDIFSNYETVTLHIYNDGETDFSKRIYYNDWKGFIEVKKGEWKEIVLPVKEFFFSPLAITEINGGGYASPCTGSLYFSKAIGSVSQYKYIGFLLDKEIPVSINSTNCDLEVLSNSGFKLTSEVVETVYVRLNKKILELEKDNVYLIVDSSITSNMSLLGFDSNPIKNVPLSKGINKIELTGLDYSKIFALTFDLVPGAVISVPSFFVYEESFSNGAFVIASYSALPNIEEMSEDNVCTFLEFFNKYDALNEEEKIIVSQYISGIKEGIDAYRNKMIQNGEHSILNSFVSKKINEYKLNEGIPYTLLAISSSNFVLTNLSNVNKSELDEIAISYGVAFGDLADDFNKGFDYPWTGSVSRNLDENHGYLYDFSVSSSIGTQIQIELGSFRNVDQYSSLTFRLFNPTDSKKTCYFYTQVGSNWVLVSNFNVSARSWETVSLDASLVTNSRNFILIPNTEPTSGYKMTPFIGTNKNVLVNKLSNEIEKLPEQIETNDRLTKMTCLSLMDLYQSLSTETKSLITNYSKLQSLVTKYCIDIEIAYKATSSSYRGVTGEKLDSYSIENKGYGNYATSMLLTEAEDKDNHRFLSCKNDLLTNLATKYDHVAFYIFAPADCPTPQFFAQYSVGWHGPSSNLVAGQWNEIVISGDEFFNYKEDKTGNMDFWVKGSTNNLGSGNWKITSFYGYND